MTGRQYNLLDIQNIIFAGIYYKLDDDIMKKIRSLEKELGVVEEPRQVQRQVVVTADKKRTPQIPGQQLPRRNGDKKNKEMSNEDWNMLKNFKATQFETKEGHEKIIENIRTLVNKISTKNYQQQFEQIQKEIHDYNVSIEGEDEEEEQKQELIRMLFNIITNNKFFSELYASLYIDLLPSFEQFNQQLKTYIQTLKGSIEQINYVNSDDNYDKYCEYVKENESRKANTQFLINLCKKNALTVDQLLDILDYFIDKTLEYVDMDNKTNEVEEITENVFLIISSSQALIHKQAAWTNCVLPKVIAMSQKKKNDHKSLSNRAIFKYMDIIDSIDIDI